MIMAQSLASSLAKETSSSSSSREETTTPPLCRQRTDTTRRRRRGGRLPIRCRIALIRLWYRYDGDVRKVLEAIRGTNDDDDTAAAAAAAVVSKIDGRSVRATILRFQKHGVVHDLPRSGRRRSVRTTVTIEDVRKSLRSDPMLSTRKRARRLNISRSSLMRIQRLDLLVRPYKVQLTQQIKSADTQQRLDLCERMLRLVRRSNGSFVHRLIMGDEAHFDLTGSVFNRQNVRFWGTENPHLLRERKLHNVRVTVWCGVSSRGILGPYFFESPEGATLSVNGERYRAMLEDYVGPQLRSNPRYSVVRDWWWQQDGATAHTAGETFAVLRSIFGWRRIISRGAAFSWPPRSPDLTAPDYFLWGYLKDRVYRIEDDLRTKIAAAAAAENRNDDAAAAAAAAAPAVTPLTRTELKRAIKREVDRLNEGSNDDLRRSVMNNLVERLRVCARENGRYLLDILFRT